MIIAGVGGMSRGKQQLTINRKQITINEKRIVRCEKCVLYIWGMVE